MTTYIRGADGLALLYSMGIVSLMVGKCRSIELKVNIFPYGRDSLPRLNQSRSALVDRGAWGRGVASQSALWIPVRTPTCLAGNLAPKRTTKLRTAPAPRPTHPPPAPLHNPRPKIYEFCRRNTRDDAVPSVDGGAAGGGRYSRRGVGLGLRRRGGRGEERGGRQRVGEVRDPFCSWDMALEYWWEGYRLLTRRTG